MKKIIAILLMLVSFSAVAKSASGTVVMYIQWRDSFAGDRSVISGFDSVPECQSAASSLIKQARAAKDYILDAYDRLDTHCFDLAK